MYNICTNCTGVSQSCWLYFLGIINELEIEREKERQRAKSKQVIKTKVVVSAVLFMSLKLFCITICLQKDTPF